jgi:hypothetical protein
MLGAVCVALGTTLKSRRKFSALFKILRWEEYLVNASGIRVRYDYGAGYWVVGACITCLPLLIMCKLRGNLASVSGIFTYVLLFFAGNLTLCLIASQCGLFLQLVASYLTAFNARLFRSSKTSSDLLESFVLAHIKLSRLCSVVDSIYSLPLLLIVSYHLVSITTLIYYAVVLRAVVYDAIYYSVWAVLHFFQVWFFSSDFDIVKNKVILYYKILLFYSFSVQL